MLASAERKCAPTTTSTAAPLQVETFWMIPTPYCDTWTMSAECKCGPYHHRHRHAAADVLSSRNCQLRICSMLGKTVTIEALGSCQVR